VKRERTCLWTIADAIIGIDRFASACLCERDVPDGTDAHPRHRHIYPVVCAVGSEVEMPTKGMIKAIVIAGALVIAMAWPDALSAQRHGGGGGGGRGGGGGGGRTAGPSRGGGGHDGGGQSGRGGRAGGRDYSGPSRVVVSRPYYSRAFYGPAYYYGYYGLGYYSPFFGSPWYWGYPAFMFGGPYGYGYGYGYGYPYGYGYGGWYDPRGSARILVKPKNTEVFVDGSFVGVADDFDGVFQGMKLDPGGHEITLYLDGYRKSTHKVMLQDGKTLKLRHDMVKLGDNEPREARPVAPPTPPRPAGPPGRPGARGVPTDDPDMTEPPAVGPPDRDGWPPRRHPGPSSRARSSREAGHLIIRVQPADAEVWIDGERWQMPGDQERLDVAVPEGEHTIEIRKEGYQPFTSTVTVRRGENTPLNVSLPKVR
jgi:hypothetical protein